MEVWDSFENVEKFLLYDYYEKDGHVVELWMPLNPNIALHKQWNHRESCE